MKITLTSDSGKVFEKDINKEIANFKDKVLDLANQAKETVATKSEDFKGLTNDDIDLILSKINDLINTRYEDNTSDDCDNDCCSDSFDDENEDYDDFCSEYCSCEDEDDDYIYEGPYENEDCHHVLEEQSTDPSIEKNYSDNRIDNITAGKRSIIINGDIVINILN